MDLSNLADYDDLATSHQAQNCSDRRSIGRIGSNFRGALSETILGVAGPWWRRLVIVAGCELALGALASGEYSDSEDGDANQR